MGYRLAWPIITREDGATNNFLQIAKNEHPAHYLHGILRALGFRDVWRFLVDTRWQFWLIWARRLAAEIDILVTRVNVFTPILCQLRVEVAPISYFASVQCNFWKNYSEIQKCVDQNRKFYKQKWLFLVDRILKRVLEKCLAWQIRAIRFIFSEVEDFRDSQLWWFEM